MAWSEMTRSGDGCPDTAIDKALALKSSSPLYELRRARPDYIDGAEACRASVLTPEEDQGLPADLRAALAVRMARSIGAADLYADEGETMQGDTVLARIAKGEMVDGAGAQLIIIVRHVDLVTVMPVKSTRADIEALAEAGLTNPQIVALSELIAFVAFEARVVVGLRMLGNSV